jgi:hypothetical protein
MNTDLIFVVIGLVLGALSSIAAVNAFSEGRAPRFGAIMVLIGGAGDRWLSQKPGGYTVDGYSQAFSGLSGRLF